MARTVITRNQLVIANAADDGIDIDTDGIVDDQEAQAFATAPLRLSEVLTVGSETTFNFGGVLSASATPARLLWLHLPYSAGIASYTIKVSDAQGTPNEDTLTQIAKYVGMNDIVWALHGCAITGLKITPNAGTAGTTVDSTLIIAGAA